jgi:hypothetical protein
VDEITNIEQTNQFLLATNDQNDYFTGVALTRATIEHLGINKFVSSVINLSWLSYDTAYKLSSISETVAFFEKNQADIKAWLLRLDTVPTSRKLILPSGYGTASKWKGDGDLLDYLSDSLQKVARVNFDRSSIKAVVFDGDMNHYDAIFIADAMTKFTATVIGVSFQRFIKNHYPSDSKKLTA